MTPGTRVRLLADMRDHHDNTLPGLGSVLDSARGAMVVLRPDGTILLTNAAAREFSHREGPLENVPLWEAGWWGLDGSVREKVRQAVFEAAAGDRAGAVLEVPGPQGRRTVELSIGRIRRGDDGVGPPDLLLAESHDITEHMELAAALQKTLVQYEAVLASALDPVIIIDAFGTMLSVSRSIERVFGYKPEEVIGQNVRVLMPEPHHSAHDGYLANYRRTGQTNILGRTREFEARRKDGSRVPIELSVSRVDVPGESQPLFTGIIHDITERRIAERLVKDNAAALERSNRELEQFAYVASHDLQEPLRMVGSFAGLLARRYKGRLDAEADEFIEYIINGAERMKMLIEDLLAYSRVSTKGRPPAPVPMRALVDQVLADLRSTATESGAVVHVGDLPEVLADATQMGQVMLNLIGNAIKFRGQGRPEVWVTAKARPGEWEFAVRDNGIGIDPRYAERIFKIFERLHGAAEYPGTGIGLAICKKIVERHGGRIWFESEPGKGTTFRFTLPRQEVCA